MKSLAAIVVGLFLAGGLAACGSGGSETRNAAPTPTVSAEVLKQVEAKLQEAGYVAGKGLGNWLKYDGEISKRAHLSEVDPYVEITFGEEPALQCPTLGGSPADPDPVGYLNELAALGREKVLQQYPECAAN